jgi:hypothetical protein
MKILYSSSGGKLPVSKLKIRWIEAVEEDAKKIPSIRNWKREARIEKVGEAIFV